MKCTVKKNNSNGKEAEMIEIDIYKLWSMPEEKRFEHVENLITKNRKLQERVRKLEQQREWLAKKCEDLSDYVEDYFIPHTIFAKTWIERAEQATDSE